VNGRLHDKSAGCACAGRRRKSPRTPGVPHGPCGKIPARPPGLFLLSKLKSSLHNFLLLITSVLAVGTRFSSSKYLLETL
jgi:hypothetical protein